MGPDVHVRDTETGHEYFVTEERFRNQPKEGLWVRLDQGKPKTSVADAAAKNRPARKRAAKKATSKPAATKKAASGHPADSNQEES